MGELKRTGVLCIGGPLDGRWVEDRGRDFSHREPERIGSVYDLRSLKNEVPITTSEARYIREDFYFVGPDGRVRIDIYRRSELPLVEAFRLLLQGYHDGAQEIIPDSELPILHGARLRPLPPLR